MSSNKGGYAYLRIRGYGPSSEITERLRLEPDNDWSEGDDWKDREPNLKRFFTHWEIREEDGGDLNDQIRNVLFRNRRKKNELLSLASDYDICMVCVIFDEMAFSFELDFDLQRQLTAFGIRIWFDAYTTNDPHDLIQDLKDEIKTLRLKNSR